MTAPKEYLIICLLPLSESSLLLWCLLLFIVACLWSSAVGLLHKQDQKLKTQKGVVTRYAAASRKLLTFSNEIRSVTKVRFSDTDTMLEHNIKLES